MKNFNTICVKNGFYGFLAAVLLCGFNSSWILAEEDPDLIPPPPFEAEADTEAEDESETPEIESDAEPETESNPLDEKKKAGESQNRIKYFPVIANQPAREEDVSEELPPPDLNTELNTDLNTELEAESNSGAEIKPETDSDSRTDSDPDLDLNIEPDFKTDSGLNTDSDPNLGLNTDSDSTRQSDEKNTQEEDSTELSVPSVLPKDPPKEPKIPEITEEELQLREKILHTLKVYERISLSSKENRPAEIISFIVPYGCEAEIYYGNREENQRINAIGALCWNVPMGNEAAFTESTRRLMPRLGYGIQQYSGQLLAAMAIARVPIDYRFPAGWSNVAEKEKESESEDSDSEKATPRGKKNFGITNLVEFEKQNCEWGKDLSQTLIGLSYYLEPDEEWVADDGEKWTLERIVQNELERPISAGDSKATNQLLGLLCAVRCRKMKVENEELTGQYKRADSYMVRFQKFVLDLQNEIGIWHPKFFLKKGMTPEQPTEMLIASGHILRWLVCAAPREELGNPQITKAVQIVNELLEFQLTYWDPGNAPGTEIEGIMTALHALAIYEKRRFK